MSIHLLRDDDLLDLTRYVPPFFPLLKKLNQHGDITIRDFVLPIKKKGLLRSVAFGSDLIRRH
ncbi:hypothetical protein M513_07482 [Trichuris suis]|uniref:Uncharacterized protein n=1 Tax=Trichuris suis TaxID=68888 RepID=A0A085M307_9BILA|nr:hypothetical protein M513_07482 [Trichuris suis]